MAGAAITIYILTLKIEALTLEKKAAVEAAEGYRAALETYRDSFKNQMDTLSFERQHEIKRQEHLLRTLNLIGDLNESLNSPVSDSGLMVIDSLYGSAGEAAAHHPD